MPESKENSRMIEEFIVMNSRLETINDELPKVRGFVEQSYTSVNQYVDEVKRQKEELSKEIEAFEKMRKEADAIINDIRRASEKMDALALRLDTVETRLGLKEDGVSTSESIIERIEKLEELAEGNVETSRHLGEIERIVDFLNVKSIPGKLDELSEEVKPLNNRVKKLERSVENILPQRICKAEKAVESARTDLCERIHQTETLVGQGLVQRIDDMDVTVKSVLPEIRRVERLIPKDAAKRVENLEGSVKNTIPQRFEKLENFAENTSSQRFEKLEAIVTNVLPGRIENAEKAIQELQSEKETPKPSAKTEVRVLIEDTKLAADIKAGLKKTQIKYVDQLEKKIEEGRIDGLIEGGYIKKRNRQDLLKAKERGYLEVK